jgi:hypothetical protein
MKTLLYKEFRLAAHPTTYLFLSFGVMLLIPNYPGYVAFLYMCLSVFFLFLSGRENNDIFYTVMLPINKRDVVKARCFMISIIELSQIVISVPFAFLSAKIYPEGSNLAGIETNIAFYGFVFVFFTVFNLIFIPTFYKTAYKIGIPFLLASLVVIVSYVGFESLVWIPSSLQTFLDTTDPNMMGQQLPILLAGIGIWIIGMVWTYRIAAVKFEKVDL